MPGSASSSHRPERLIDRLRSATADGGNAKLKVLREPKNQIIDNRTKKLSYTKLGAVPFVVSILSLAPSSDPIIIQCAATIGGFACGVDSDVNAVLDAGTFERKEIQEDCKCKRLRQPRFCPFSLPVRCPIRRKAAVRL